MNQSAGKRLQLIATELLTSAHPLQKEAEMELSRLYLGRDEIPKKGMMEECH